MKRLLVSLFLALAASATVLVPPAHALEYVNRIASVNASPGIYEWITPDLTSTAAGKNLYIRFDRLPAQLKVRWVKCGHTSTQDGASSVGGNAVTVTTDGGWVVGTNFLNGTCVRIWARVVYQQSARTYYPIEAYFDYRYRP